MTLFEIIHNALTRFVRAQEAIEDGEHSLAWQILNDLEHDVCGWLERFEDAA